MIKGTTKSGFKYSISDDSLNDWELLKQLRELDKGKMGVIVDVVPMLLGEEQEKRLEDHCRKDGKIKVDLMFNEISEILNNSNAGKNSSSSSES